MRKVHSKPARDEWNPRDDKQSLKNVSILADSGTASTFTAGFGNKKLFIAMRVRRRRVHWPRLQIYCKAARL